MIHITSEYIKICPSLIEREDVLSLVVVDEVELLQRGDDVVLLDRGLLANLVDGHRGRVAVRVVGIGILWMI